MRRGASNMFRFIEISTSFSFGLRLIRGYSLYGKPALGPIRFPACLFVYMIRFCLIVKILGNLPCSSFIQTGNQPGHYSIRAGRKTCQ
jgi:hypothetical protein